MRRDVILYLFFFKTSDKRKLTLHKICNLEIETSQTKSNQQSHIVCYSEMTAAVKPQVSTVTYKCTQTD